MSHRYHYPKGSSQTPTGDEPRRGECGTCGRQIVYIEGYELRRSYWRAIGGRHDRR